MADARARRGRTIALVKVARAMGHARATPGRVPSQIPPTAIELAFGRALGALVSAARIRAAYAPLLEALPGLIAAAQRKRQDSDEEDRRVRELAAQAHARLRAGLNANEIEALATRIAGQVSAHNRQQLNRQTRSVLGVDAVPPGTDLHRSWDGFAEESADLITNVSDVVRRKVQALAMSAVQSARPHPQLAEQIAAIYPFGEKRAKLIARDQVGKLYGALNAERQRRMGVEKFVWRTVGDERVREEHEALDGETFSYDDPPSEGLPGEEVNCRCYADPVFEDLEGDLEEEEGGEE